MEAKRKAEEGSKAKKKLEMKKSNVNRMNILLVAPHGFPGDDDNTGKLVRLVAEQTGCYAIINEVYQKTDTPNDDSSANKQDKRVNLNRKGQVEAHLKEEFLNPLIKYKSEIVEKFGNALLLWIHGADDDNVPEGVKVIVGYGQGKDDTKHTAKIDIKDALVERLNENSLKAVDAKPDENRFCASDINNMSQYFRLQGESLDTLQSIQLEFRKQDCRDTDKSIKTTARDIANALSVLVAHKIEAGNKDAPDAPIQEKSLVKRITGSESFDNIIEIADPIVDKAYNKLALVFSKNYERALMEAGQYIVRTFYGGEEGIEGNNYDEHFNYTDTVIKNARNNDSPLGDSLNRLYDKISGEKAHNTPSRSWIYNAVNLVVLQYDMKKLLKKEHFQTFGNLLLSQKLLLLSVENSDKQKMVEYCHDKDKALTFKEFRGVLNDSQSTEETVPLKLPALLRKPEELKKDENASRLAPERLVEEKKDTLKRLKNIAETQHDSTQSKIDRLKEELEKWEKYSNAYVATKANIEKAIEFKETKSKKNKPKNKTDAENPNQDWADDGINVSTGCSHDCRYCYARDGQIRKGNKTLETWHIEKPRPETVDKGWRKTKKRKLFPSIHDITPGTYDDSVKLIKNFLKPGNMLLIVSKPHPDLIEKLCDEIDDCKEQVLFRFTISATNNELLKFWEPGAPSFEKRLEALKIAKEKGFETSISIEPMLDNENISKLIEALKPHTTDSIWIGTMNNISRRVKNKDKPEVAKHIGKIEAGQTADKLATIYEDWKGEPLVKYKSHIRNKLAEIGIEVPKAEDDWRERRVAGGDNE